MDTWRTSVAKYFELLSRSMCDDVEEAFKGVDSRKERVSVFEAIDISKNICNDAVSS